MHLRVKCEYTHAVYQLAVGAYLRIDFADLLILAGIIALQAFSLTTTAHTHKSHDHTAVVCSVVGDKCSAVMS